MDSSRPPMGPGSGSGTSWIHFARLPAWAMREPSLTLDRGQGSPGSPWRSRDCEISLIESRHRRAAFLEWLVEQLGLRTVHVIPVRAELVADTFDACLARALGDAESSWRLAERLIPEGALLYFAGATFRLDRCAIEGVDCGICLEGRFPWQGPLVMMTRREHRTT